jgi:regulator of cell morphogenesis and NO signaling
MVRSENEIAPPDCVTGVLGSDHDRLDALLAEAKRLLAEDPTRAAACFAAFRSGLERHIAAEEEVLFSAFETLTGIPGGGPTHVMRLEHAEIRGLLAEVGSRLERGDGARPTSLLGDLTALLLAHNGKEDRILYPACDRAARQAGRLDTLVQALREACGINAAEAAADAAPRPHGARV